MKKCRDKLIQAITIKICAPPQKVILTAFSILVRFMLPDR